MATLVCNIGSSLDTAPPVNVYFNISGVDNLRVRAAAIKGAKRSNEDSPEFVEITITRPPLVNVPDKNCISEKRRKETLNWMRRGYPGLFDSARYPKTVLLAVGGNNRPQIYHRNWRPMWVNISPIFYNRSMVKYCIVK